MANITITVVGGPFRTGPFEGQTVVFSVSVPPSLGTFQNAQDWTVTSTSGYYVSTSVVPEIADPSQFDWDTTGIEPGDYVASATVHYTDKAGNPQSAPIKAPAVTVHLRPISKSDTLPVTLRRSAEQPTSDQALWVVIRNSANALSFDNYLRTIDTIMCCPGSLDDRCSNDNDQDCSLPPLSQRRALPFPDMDAYRVLKIATECFLMMHCGVYLTPAKLQALLQNSDPNNPPYDPNDDAGRLDQNAAGLPGVILNYWKAYLASGNQYLNAKPTKPGLPDPDVVLRNLTIPYLALVRARLRDLDPREDYEMGIQCYGILKRKLTNPCLIELIWSYWQEEGMLVQTLNAISRRFQNLRGPGDRDPLARFDIDPLRRLNSLLWGYIQDEQHRLTVRRRAYEYNHEYGLNLEGKALRALRPSDSRSKFLEAFHNLLNLCAIFFKEDDDTTVVADGFPVLNALKEVHYILAAGAHNQFGDLPSTARQEMFMQQWLLARPEMREFLGGKVMVPYPEEWMDRVDNVKSMQGWTDVSVIYFRDLAVYGEQIVLSIRYGAWSITNNPAQAANWARYWRPEIQAYIHAYRAATGVDLTTEPVNSTLPSVLLLRRLATQRPVAPR